MTPVQIAYFKHFLFDRSLQKHYIGTYRKKRYEENPESLEEFLQSVSPEKAIMDAFFLKPGSEYGVDYWKGITEKWLKYLELYEDNPKNDSYMFLKGGFAILKQNWDKPIYFEKESDDETYKRMHIEKPDIDDRLFREEEHRGFTPKFKKGDIVKGTISGDVCKITSVCFAHSCYLTDDDGAIDFDREEYWELVPEAASEEDENELIEFSDVPEAEEEQENNSQAILAGFSLVDTANVSVGRRISANTVTVNLRNKGYKLTFSKTQSEKLRKEGYKFVKLLTNKDSGEVALLFNMSNGCGVTIKKEKDNNRNVTVNSKEIVESIHKFYGISKTKDYYTLKITDVIKHNLDTIFKMKYEE